MLNFKEYLWKLSGADYIVIKQCDRAIQSRFSKVGFLVLLNGFFCFCSGFYSFYCFINFSNVFLNLFLAGLIASFFSWMVTNIYLVLLGTLSKNLLPHVSNSQALWVSTIIRILFLVFIAIIVSKPLEVLLRSFANSELSHYEFAKNLKLVGNIPGMWVLTFVSIIAFVLPAAIKYFVAENDTYYIRKTQYEKYLILNNYEDFKLEYKKLMYKSTGKVIEFKEQFKNPPFNTKRIIQTFDKKEEKDFIDLIYGDKAG